MQNVASDAFTFEAWIRTNDFCHRGELDCLDKPSVTHIPLWLDLLVASSCTKPWLSAVQRLAVDLVILQGLQLSACH